MKFPKFSPQQSRPAQANLSLQTPPANPASDQRTGSAWSTALLMIGSALVGATAVAVWNRSTIAEMRSHLELSAGRDTLDPIADNAPTANEIF